MHALCTVLLIAALAVGFFDDAKAAMEPHRSKPNILIFLTDDQTRQSIVGRDSKGQPFMPFIQSKLDKARRFSESYFVQPVCWASRATLLTGMYPHNHNISEHDTLFYRDFMDAGLDQISWPKLLRAEGYYTGYFGKFLNAYDGRSVPAGWDWWFSLVRFRTAYNWTARRNGKIVEFSGNNAGVYMTNVLVEDLIDRIGKQASRYKKPFAFIIAPRAPHLPADPAPQYAGLYSREPFQPKRSPSYNEADVSDKPSHVRSLRRLTHADTEAIADNWRATLESARSIDKAFELIWKALADRGQLKNTYIVFVSDNGFMWGEHRIAERKAVVYQESIRSQTYIWGPGVVPGVDARMISNLDFLATFMDIAGGSMPAVADGAASLLPLLRNQSPSWRRTFLVRGLPIRSEPAPNDATRWRALVTPDWKYVWHEDGQVEFYDLVADPHELANAASDLSHGFAAAVEDRIEQLYTCVGEECAAIERLPPPTN